ncbi:hypothetical protein B14911_14872 [Bacillus sp. NRRL B-14911]|nr:hypothetical protein B14911_14872 [Bacillus sp. NRRL B-14911]
MQKISFGQVFQGKKIITISAEAVYIKWAAAAGAAAFGFSRTFWRRDKTNFLVFPLCKNSP